MMTTTSDALGHGPIQDPKVRAVIARLENSRQRPGALALVAEITRRLRYRMSQEGKAGDPYTDHSPAAFADVGFSIHPEQGDLIYLLCRGMGARRVVDFATSVGMSALYFAAAMRDNGGGKVIGAEIVPKKIETARRNLTDAGLQGLVEIRAGDARETLRDLGGPVDFVLIDGWPGPGPVSLAREVIAILAPQLRVGGYVLNDNAEPDFLAFIRDPRNGFISMTLPIKRGTELALKVTG
jgi:predicted O-methyltransferase YrrM